MLLLMTTSYVVLDNWQQPIETLAILPFENPGGDAETLYLGEGIRDGLIMRLSRIPRLKRSSATLRFARIAASARLSSRGSSCGSLPGTALRPND